jgi:anti-anti-sigma regulatory factor
VQFNGEIDLSNAGQVAGLAGSTVVTLDMSGVSFLGLPESPRSCDWPQRCI